MVGTLMPQPSSTMARTKSSGAAFSIAFAITLRDRRCWAADSPSSPSGALQRSMHSQMQVCHLSQRSCSPSRSKNFASSKNRMRGRNKLLHSGQRGRFGSPRWRAVAKGHESASTAASGNNVSPMAAEPTTSVADSARIVASSTSKWKSRGTGQIRWLQGCIPFSAIEPEQHQSSMVPWNSKRSLGPHTPSRRQCLSTFELNTKNGERLALSKMWRKAPDFWPTRLSAQRRIAA
mmetsp:Transcript_45618/g.97460  ORF Transcript_45618/g.97460 Transcript_45618/m.97460 type:complete len:234 (-) Transcript_45618:491-1192(-)